MDEPKEKVSLLSKKVTEIREELPARWDHQAEQKTRLALIPPAFRWSIWLVSTTIAFYIMAVFLNGFGIIKLSDAALGEFAGTVIVQTVGLVVIVFRYLFAQKE